MYDVTRLFVILRGRAYRDLAQRATSIRLAMVKNVRCFETADKWVSGILPHYYGWSEFNRTAMAVSKFVVSLKLSIISLPESLPCCYTCLDFRHVVMVSGDFTMFQKT